VTFIILGGLKSFRCSRVRSSQKTSRFIVAESNFYQKAGKRS